MHRTLENAQYAFVFTFLSVSMASRQKGIRQDWNATDGNAQLLARMHGTMLMQNV
jgi:hypothetical protein